MSKGESILCACNERFESFKKLEISTPYYRHLYNKDTQFCCTFGFLAYNQLNVMELNFPYVKLLAYTYTVTASVIYFFTFSCFLLFLNSDQLPSFYRTLFTNYTKSKKTFVAVCLALQLLTECSQPNII